MNRKNEHLIPEVVFRDNRSWRLTPGYINTYISDAGEIRLLNSKSDFVTPRTFEWKTTKGTYKYIKIINDDFVPVTKAIHQLVCLTYHGSPPNDGFSYEPNHKDGDKHNNHPSNLEWLTRSKNVQHAFDQGHCQAGLKIDAINQISGEIKRHYSLSSMARQWGIPRHLLRNLIAEHRDKPYLDEWVFTLDDSQDKAINRYQRLPLQFRDYVTEVIKIVNDSTEASMLTGVKATTITSRINGKIKNAEALLSRYVFRPLNVNTEWPQYTVDEALKSEELYLLNSSKKRFSRM